MTNVILVKSDINISYKHVNDTCHTNYRQQMCAADKVWITELTLIHKNIRSVRNSKVYLSIWHKTHYDVTDKNNNVSSNI